MTDVASMAVTDDAFLGDALRILQPKAGYRAGVDAVLLAATAVSSVDTVLDAGAGVGVVGLCVARRLPDARVTLLEREGELVATARENVARNLLGDRVCVVQGDIVGSAALLRDSVPDESFAAVLANPPFYLDGRGTVAATSLKAVSHSMDVGDLDQWARFAARVVRPGGTFTMVHTADALSRLLGAFGQRFGAIKIKPVYARTGEPAIRVIVSGVKGSRAPLQIRDGLILHGMGNDFRPEVAAILRDGAPLAI